MFLNMEMPYFCCTILLYSTTALSSVPGTNLNNKRVGIYVDSAKKLVRSNLPPNQRVHLFMDQEERIARTKFVSRMKKMNPIRGSKVVNIEFVDSGSQEHCLMQICDLLTGAIKHWIAPGFGRKSKYKKEFALYVMKELGITTCSRAVKSKPKAKSGKNKVCLSYWKVPNFRIKKNRS